jgi:hypothetical protein
MLGFARSRYRYRALFRRRSRCGVPTERPGRRQPAKRTPLGRQSLKRVRCRAWSKHFRMYGDMKGASEAPRRLSERSLFTGRRLLLPISSADVHACSGGLSYICTVLSKPKYSQQTVVEAIWKRLVLRFSLAALSRARHEQIRRLNQGSPIPMECYW